MKLINYLCNLLVFSSLLMSVLNREQTFLKKQTNEEQNIKNNQNENFKSRFEKLAKNSLMSKRLLSTHDNNLNNLSDSATSVRVYEGICYVKIHGWIYDINPLGFEDDNTYLIDTGKFRINLNFCRDIPNYCYDGRRGLVVDKNKCIRYAGEWTKDKEWRIEKYSNGTSRALIDLPEGDPCPKGGNYTIQLDLTCDPSEKKNKMLNRMDFNPDSCYNVFKFVTPYACPMIKFTAWYQSFYVHKYVIASLMVLIGFSLVFLGNHFPKISSALIISVGAGIAAHKILGNLGVDLIYIYCLLIGMGVSCLIIYWDEIRNILTAIVMGFLITTLFFPSILNFSDSQPGRVYDMCLMVSIGICLITHSYTHNTFITFASAFAGAYAAVRGLSIVIGRYPDEGLIINLIRKKEFNQLERVFGPSFYFYLAGIVALMIVGIIIQFMFKPGDEKVIKEDINKKRKNKAEEEDNNE